MRVLGVVACSSTGRALECDSGGCGFEPRQAPLQREWTILIDEREKRPLRFPDHLVLWDRGSSALDGRTTTVRLHTKTQRMLTGDYVLEGFASKVIVERKGSLDELGNNLLTKEGRRKFVAEMERLRAECSHPIVLLEGCPLSLASSVRRGSNPALVRDTLLGLLHEYNVELMLLPSSSPSSRMACAEWLAAKLITGALHHAQPHLQPPGPQLP